MMKYRMSKFIILTVLFLSNIVMSLFPDENGDIDVNKFDRIVAVIPEDLPPTYFKNKKSGKPDGFAVEVMKELAKALDIKVEYKFAKAWDEILALVLSKEDHIALNVGVSDRRQKLFLLTDTTETTTMSLVILRDNDKIDSITNTIVVGCIRSSTSYDYLKGIGHIKITTFDNAEELLFDLLAGHIDAVLVPLNNFIEIAEEFRVSNKIKVVEKSFVETKRAIAFNKKLENSQFFSDFNNEIIKFVHSPKYRELYTKWYGKKEPLLNSMQIIVISLVLFIILVIVMLIWRYISISQKNRELRSIMLKREKTEQKYKMLFNSMQNGFALHEIICDKERNPIDYRFIDINPAFERMTGISRDVAVGKTVLEILPKTEEYWIREYGEVALKGVPKHFENYSQEFNKYYEVTAYRPEKDQFAVIISDVTERRIAEEKIKQLNRSLEIKNADLEQLLYVASHDLRSPLVNVQGFSHEINLAFTELKSIMSESKIDQCKKVKAIIEDNIDSSMAFIFNSIEKMDKLLNGILRLSRVGKIVATTKKIDMNSFIKNIIKNFNYQIKTHNVTVEISNLTDCMADEILLDQVFANIIDNAIKYLKKDQIDAKIKISSYTDNNDVIYCIEDNGIGVKKEYFEKIFELFYRLNPKEIVGEGVGLTIVKKNLTTLNGNIWVSSDIDIGSKFYLLLPKG